MSLSFFSPGFPLFASLLLSPSAPTVSLGPNQSSVVGKGPIVCGAISCGSGESYLHVDEKKKNRLAEEEHGREKNHTEKEKPATGKWLRLFGDSDILKRETEKEWVDQFLEILRTLRSHRLMDYSSQVDFANIAASQVSSPLVKVQWFTRPWKWEHCSR